GFMAIGDAATARRLGDAAARPFSNLPAALNLAKAEVLLADGEAVAAQSLGDKVLSTSNVTPDAAAILLVEAAFSGDRTLPSGTADRLEALFPEARLHGREAEMRRAQVLASAMEGSFDRAFS